MQRGQRQFPGAAVHMRANFGIVLTAKAGIRGALASSPATPLGCPPQNRGHDGVQLFKARVAGMRPLNERGFSVVEGLVSAALLAVCLLPLAYIQTSGTRNAVSANQVAIASALAVEAMEKINNLRYADPRLQSTSGAFVDLPSTLGPANPVAGYTPQWKITSNSPLANGMTVDVRVQWNTYAGRIPNPTPRAVTVSFIKAAN